MMLVRRGEAFCKASFLFHLDLSMTTYWHMQIHPDDVSFSDEHLHAILEQRSIIGVGEWEKRTTYHI